MEHPAPEYVEACLRHGKLHKGNGKFVQLVFRGEDLDKAFELMGATVLDIPCTQCIHEVKQFYPTLFKEE